MKIKAIYENNVLKPLGDLKLPNKALVSITIHESFSDLLDELGEPEAKEDIDAVLKETRTRRYYDLDRFGYIRYSKEHLQTTPLALQRSLF